MPLVCYLIAHYFDRVRQILAQAYSLTANNMEEQDAFDEVYGSLATIIKREKENAESYRKQILEQDPLDLSDDFVRGNMKFDEEQQLKRSLQQLDQTVRYLSKV